MSSFAAARRNMIDGQLRTFEVTDRAVLAAMDEIPRERFVPAEGESLAYTDRHIALPGGGADPRFLLAPMLLARLVQALAIRAGQTVLDVAGGSGYTAAVFAALGARVFALEPRSDLDGLAAAGLAASGLAGRVDRTGGPLPDGRPDAAPFDAILINGAIATEPAALLGQLADGGQLTCIRTDGVSGRATLFVRSGDTIASRVLFDAAAPALPAFARTPAFAF